MKCMKVLVILLICGVIAGVVGSSALAAPKKTSKAELTLLDPFTLEAVMLSNAGVSDVMLTRQAIRVPLRPNSRSAFRPDWR